MNNQEVERKGWLSRLSWIPQAVIIMLLVPTTGLVPTAAGFIAYYGLKGKIGIILSLLAGAVAVAASFTALVFIGSHSR